MSKVNSLIHAKKHNCRLKISPNKSLLFSFFYENKKVIDYINVGDMYIESVLKKYIFFIVASKVLINKTFKKTFVEKI